MDFMFGVGILVAAIAHWFFGALWYSPLLFGNKWVQLGKIEKNAEKMKMAMIIGFIISLAIAAIMGCLFYQFQIRMIIPAATLAIKIWLGFIATVTGYQVIYENKPLEFYMLNNGFYASGLIIVASILVFFI